MPRWFDRKKFPAHRAILLGTLTVGVLDGLDAVLFFWLRSATPPMRIFQSIAAGLLGRASYQGGWRTALAGVALHFAIAFGIVLTYFAASRIIPVLRRRAVLFGILYGLIVYAVMNYVVIPLSAIPPRTAAIPAPVLINGLLIHAFGVGLPAALFARASR